MSPQTLFHTRAVDFFTSGLRSLVPDGLEVLREFTIDIDRRNRPEPDVVVFREDVLTDMAQTRFAAEAVLLAIEVVSPSPSTATARPSP